MPVRSPPVYGFIALSGEELTQMTRAFRLYEGTRISFGRGVRKETLGAEWDVGVKESKAEPRLQTGRAVYQHREKRDEPKDTVGVKRWGINF